MNKVLGFLLLIEGILAFQNEQTIITDSGLIFSKSHDVIVTGDSWTIVLGLNVTRHLNNALNLQKKVTSVMTNEKYKFQMNNTEVQRLMHVTEELVEVNRAMTDMLATKRRVKRLSLFEISPSFIFNFGSNIDADEFRQTRESLLKLEYEHESQRRLLDQHISFTKILDKKVEGNTKRILELTEKVEEEFIRYQTQLKKFNSDLIQLENKFDYTTNISSIYRTLGAEGLHSLIAANRLQHALEMAAEGKLSFYLLTPRELQKELIAISSLLPFGARLLRGLSVEDMYKYREIAKVAVMADNQQIFLAVKLPLVTSQTSFNLFTVNAVPIYSIDLESSIKVTPESEYLLISDDTEYYALPDNQFISRCNGKQPMICPADIKLLKRQVATCIGTSYFRDKHNMGNSCNKQVILSGDKNVWIADRENQGWIYSLANSISLTIFCDKEFTKTMTLKGHGQLVNTSHCTLLGENFKLLRTYGNGISKKSDDHITILQPFSKEIIPPIFSNEELKELNNTRNIKSILDDIKTKRRVKKDTSRSIEVPLDLIMIKADNEIVTEGDGNKGDSKSNRHVIEPVSHHHKLDSLSGFLLVVVCVVTSVITSLVAVIIFIYLYGGKLLRRNYLRTTLTEQETREGQQPTAALCPPTRSNNDQPPPYAYLKK